MRSEGVAKEMRCLHPSGCSVPRSQATSLRGRTKDDGFPTTPQIHVGSSPPRHSNPGARIHGLRSAATPDVDHGSGPRSTQAEQPTQEPLLQATAPDTNGQTSTIPAPPPQEATEKPDVTSDTGPIRESAVPFVQVSAGSHHTCGLKADGSIVCWGRVGRPND